MRTTAATGTKSTTALRLAKEMAKRQENRAGGLQEMRHETLAAQSDCDELWKSVDQSVKSNSEFDFDKNDKDRAYKILAKVDATLEKTKDLVLGLTENGRDVVTQHCMALFEGSQNVFNTGWKAYANQLSRCMPAHPENQSLNTAGGKISDLDRQRVNMHRLQSWVGQQIERIDQFLDHPLIKNGGDINRAMLIKNKESLLPLKTMYQCGELDLCSTLIEQKWNSTHPEFLDKKAPINKQFELTSAALAKALFYDLQHSTDQGLPTRRLDPQLSVALSQLTLADQRMALAGQSENLSKVAHGYKWLIEEFQETPEAKAGQQEILGSLQKLIRQQPAKSPSPLLTELKRIATSAPAQPVFSQLQKILSAPDVELTAQSTALRIELGQIVHTAQQAQAQQVIAELHVIVGLAEDLARLIKDKFNQLPPDLSTLSVTPAAPIRSRSTTAKPAAPGVRVIQTEYQGILVGTAGERDPQTVEILDKSNALIGTYRRRDSENEIWTQEPDQEPITPQRESNLVKLKEYFATWQAQAQAALNNAESWQSYSRRALESDEGQSASSVHGCLMNHAHRLTQLADILSRRLSAPSGTDEGEAAALYAQGQQESKKLRLAAQSLEQESQAAAARMIGQRPTWAALRHWLGLELPISVRQTEVGTKLSKTAAGRARQTLRQHQLQPDSREDYLHAFHLTLNPQSAAPVVIPLHLHTSSARASPDSFKKAHFKIGSQEYDGSTSLEASGNPTRVYRSNASQQVVQRILALAAQQTPSGAASAGE